MEEERKCIIIVYKYIFSAFNQDGFSREHNASLKLRANVVERRIKQYGLLNVTPIERKRAMIKTNEERYNSLRFMDYK